MVYNHRQIEQLISRLQNVDPFSPIKLARNRLQFAYLATTLIVLSGILGEPVGNIAKSTHEDHAVVMVGPKTYPFGWRVDPLRGYPAARLRRTCYTLGFALRDRTPSAMLFLVLLLALSVVLAVF